MIKPNLFIIGAMKSGTSSLHAYLATHPDVFMCEPKEPCYFVERSQLRWPAIERYGFWRGEAHYLELFREAGRAKVVGESSTLYTKAPLISGVPARIARFAPAARFIYLLRDPVERAISHYWHEVRVGNERREMLAAFEGSPHYLEVSDYAMQLGCFLEHFNLSQFKVCTFEAMLEDPRGFMRDVLAWLDVDPGFVPPNLTLRFNARPENVNRIKGSGRLHALRYSGAWNRVGRWVPAGIRRVGRGLAEETVDPATVEDGVCRDLLRTRLAPRVEALAALLGRRFPEWSSVAVGV